MREPHSQFPSQLPGHNHRLLESGSKANANLLKDTQTKTGFWSPLTLTAVLFYITGLKQSSRACFFNDIELNIKMDNHQGPAV